jgi:hypothetical protein
MLKSLLKIKAIAPMVVLLWILLTGTACNSDDGLSREAEERVISFVTGTVGTRALPTTSVKKIGVFGYSHQGLFSTTSTTLIPDYFLNKAVIDPAGTGNWSYSGVVKYWPTDDDIKLSFFAYAPYIDVEDTFILKPGIISDQGAPTIEYTVPADIATQIDLMWSNAFDQVYATNSGRVDFTMNHALTKVNFAVKLAAAEAGRPYMVTIKELTLQNLIGEGTLNLAKTVGDADLWSFVYPADDTGLTAYTYVPGTGLADLTLDAGDLASTSSYASLFIGGHSLMLIPQILRDQLNGLSTPEVVIKYSYINTYSGETIEDEATLKLATPTLEQWLAGAGVNYQITVSLLEGTEIEFDIEGMLANTPWVDGGGNLTGDVN